MDAATPKPDPIELVRTLDPDAIRDRLESLDDEREALRVLLRAAMRKRKKSVPADSEVRT